MLKIKDNVDLKELEKYGFKPRYNEYTGRLVSYIFLKEDESSICINVEAKEFWLHMKRKPEQIFDVLYDLIKADLVEKIGDSDEKL